MPEHWRDEQRWLENRQRVILQMIHSGLLNGRPRQARQFQQELSLIETRLDELRASDEEQR